MNVDLRGIDIPDVTVTGRGESAAQQFTQYRRALADQVYAPLMEQTAQQIGNSGIVERARERVQTDPEQVAGRLARQQSRYATNLSPAAAQYQQQRMAMQNSLRGDYNMNSARIAEDEYDQAARRSLINLGTGMLGDAQQGANQAAGVAAGVKAANEQAKQANNAAWVNVGTTVLGAII